MGCEVSAVRPRAMTLRSALTPDGGEAMERQTAGGWKRMEIDSPALAARYGVSSIPSLIVFKNGRIISQRTGVASKRQWKAMLDL